MKRLVIPFVLTLFIYSCSNSVTENSFDNDSYISETDSITPLISSFVFLQKNNKDNLSFDIPCDIHQNTTIECFARNRIENKKLVASIEYKGDQIILPSGPTDSSQESLIDLSQQASIAVQYKNKQTKYTVTLYPYTGLPYISIETKDGKDILDESTLKEAYVRVIENPDSPTFSDYFNCSIRGHGNSTWEAPKKPYALKFDNKVSFFSFPSNKSWLLIANHYDTTMIRNHIVHYISTLSNLSYTPRNKFIELILNHKHKGTYQLYEKIKVSKSRVNIGDNDFLLELENHARNKDVYFSVEHLDQPIKIHSPDISTKDSNYMYIKNTLDQIDSILFSNNFLNDSTGYKKYIDIDALVEWYVFAEITKNVSSRANWYMTYERNGYLKMGPLWDYDLAFGNTPWGIEANHIPDFWINTLPWFNRFLQDSIFVKKAINRFEYFYGLKDDIMSKIDETAQKIKPAAVYNNELWTVFDCDSCSTEKVQKMYDSHVEKMKIWLEKRFEWLKDNFTEEKLTATSK